MGYIYPDLAGDGFYDPGTPCCDVCGRAQGDSPNVLRDDQAADWNGETGNHSTCEDPLRFIVERDLVIMRKRGTAR